MIVKQHHHGVSNELYQMIFNRFPIYKQTIPMTQCFFTCISYLSERDQKNKSFTLKNVLQSMKQRYTLYKTFSPVVYRFVQFKYRNNSNDNQNNNDKFQKNQEKKRLPFETVFFSILDGTISVHLPLSISFSF